MKKLEEQEAIKRLSGTEIPVTEEEIVVLSKDLDGFEEIAEAAAMEIHAQLKKRILVPRPTYPNDPELLQLLDGLSAIFCESMVCGKTC